MTIRLLVVDDDPLVRAGLSLMLGGADDIEIVGEAADGAEVPRLVDRLAPHVVLMDVRMPGVDGLTATERLRARPGAPDVVVLTTFHADEQVLRALRAGAAGFVLKDTPPAQIVDAVRKVAAGDPVLSPAVTRQLMTHVAGAAPGPAVREDDRRTAAARRLAELAEREREVALAVGRGASNAEIAATLYVSVPTVKAHVSRVLAKLGLNNRVQIALLVHDAGLLDGDGAP
ncbi:MULTISPECIES: response regulator transcription factor [Streptomyces]|uniref:Response regulator protein VraR n=2 Tax=Streptomyces TaxID=1883 RepID=A0A1D8G964_9ACTN|nr:MULTISPECIES: response regulator transcription factor [Streptomyces]AOT61953.1 Response regulator protein VraR [Streptomyces rubrolavendulae]KAF0649872.1 LuxR family transcriptional regulator [Streptomyces fradiae ATCC 10745 = DSM 40063]OSY53993.1 Response regulator protein VraR [Streptomyces fradiae ATCC 10745 = DSM 40063]QEV14834.1 DNA-binding response regulator [Streptomyces fradiae ATCC 10745 = DSM 40063]UQS29665.1 response regulator transcription factor [Streptomyces fradiae]